MDGRRAATARVACFMPRRRSESSPSQSSERSRSRSIALRLRKASRPRKGAARYTRSRSSGRLGEAEDFSGVEDVVRIKRALEALHQRNLRRIARPGEVLALLEPDAVLGRDRAAALAQRVVDHVLD